MTVVWLFGLPCSGKTTLAKWLVDYLLNQAEQRTTRQIVHLDGDVTRKVLSPELGFSKTDRMTNILRIAKLAKTLSDLGVFVICSYVTPYEDGRKMLRNLIGDDLILVHVKCPLELCIDRDVKGMYEKALKGEIEKFTGISDPFEKPEDVDIVVKSDVDKRKCFPYFLEDLNKLTPIWW